MRTVPSSAVGVTFRSSRADAERVLESRSLGPFDHLDVLETIFALEPMPSLLVRVGVLVRTAVLWHDDGRTGM